MKVSLTVEIEAPEIIAMGDAAAAQVHAEGQRGSWLANVMVTAIPEVIELVKRGQDKTEALARDHHEKMRAARNGAGTST